MRNVPEAAAGQVWRFHYSESEFYHCVLLCFRRSGSIVGHDGSLDVWRVLDLDTAEAGRVTDGYIYEGHRGGTWWTRIA